jgi:hypothetical protein
MDGPLPDYQSRDVLLDLAADRDRDGIRPDPAHRPGVADFTRPRRPSTGSARPQQIVLYYNKAMFDEAGIRAIPDETWDLEQAGEVASS